MVLLNRPNDPSPYNGLILVEPSDLKNENRYWTNCRRRVGFEFIESDTSWPNSWRMAFSLPTRGGIENEGFINSTTDTISSPSPPVRLVEQIYEFCCSPVSRGRLFVWA